MSIQILMSALEAQIHVNKTVLIALEVMHALVWMGIYLDLTITLVLVRLQF